MEFLAKKKGGLRLVPAVFDALHQSLIKCFATYYSISTEFLPDFQLYGFDHYDESKPHLGGYVYAHTKVPVNGKYLYNKVRDLRNGKREIKLTREYVYVYFRVLGYKDVFDFVHSLRLEDSDRQQQLQLCGASKSNAVDDDYYVGYYVGEDAEVIKTKLTIYDNGSKARWILVYWEGKKKPSLYTYKGIVKEAKTTISLYFDANYASTERHVLISIFFGNRNVVNRPFLFGTYSGFDRNDCPVAGEIVFQRVASEQEQEKLVHLKEVDFAIQDLVINQRIVTRATLPQHALELSPTSLYANRLSMYSGNYIGYMAGLEHNVLEEIQLTIYAGSNKARLVFTDGLVYEGYFRMSYKGMILLGWFGLSLPFQEFNLTLDSKFYKKKYILGTYSGLNKRDFPFIGKVCFIRQDSSEASFEKNRLLGLPPSNGERGNHVDEVLVYYLFSGQKNKDLFFQHLSREEDTQFNSFKESKNVVCGVYEVYSWDECGTYIKKDVLIINREKSVSLKIYGHLGKGTANMFGEGILSVCVDRWGTEKLYIQFLVFVGRYRSDEITLLSGISTSISKEFSPMAQKAIFIKTDISFDIQKSTRYNPKSEFMCSLSNTFPNIKELLSDSSFRSIKTAPSVN